ncbi:MEKHLA domain-containing protein [Paenibacillus mesophilus]|uniref:MEKHLA domain-containing protein n=1 Tax=Paenibacillus mesophilus TaxID=2582849 RepID=UPI00110EAE72|nr:MEKHLA domain-containing protein [Paenibacillus mesophilus]TMV45958.1 MEKHLA domain-containing protein [Paenibacillus mesophilus]
MRYTGVGATDEHARLIMDSYRKWTGKSLLDEGADSGNEFERLFRSPVVVLSHGTEPDPILNFGNRAALALWEMDWETFTRTPSRLTAEPMIREKRETFLKNVSDNGYVDNYTSIRISSTGRRFYIIETTVWNLADENGIVRGQAAAFREHRWIDETPVRG